MQHLRKRLTYANVISSLALFLVLGGATAFAAGKLGKNTVGTPQLKKNAVTAAKIKNGAVTGSKLKLSTLGTVPSATTAATATTATTAKTADVAKTAATAANATNAVNATNAAKATNATNAVNATNAASVNGQTAVKIFATIPNETTGATIATFAGFTIRGDCTGNDVKNLILDPPNTISNLSVSGNGSGIGPFFGANSGPEPNQVSLNGGNSRGETSFSAAFSTGTVVSGQIGYEDPDSFDGLAVCGFYGEVLVG